MAGLLPGGGRRERIICAINVTPLVDVALVLLVILMVASTYIVAQTLKVQLPRARSSDGMAERPATVTLQRDGAVLWNDEPVDEARLGEALRRAGQEPETNLVVSADREVAHGRVVQVLDLAKLAGITRFAINVRAE